MPQVPALCLQLSFLGKYLTAREEKVVHWPAFSWSFVLFKVDLVFRLIPRLLRLFSNNVRTFTFTFHLHEHFHEDEK